MASIPLNSNYCIIRVYLHGIKLTEARAMYRFRKSRLKSCSCKAPNPRKCKGAENLYVICCDTLCIF